MAIDDLTEAICWQADHADALGAPATALVVRALGVVRESDTQTGRRMREWAGLSLKDAMPLRLAGGLHHLALTGADARLAPVYAGAITDQCKVDAIVLALVHDHDTALVPWLDGPPQTNEAGRSASIMAGLLWLGAHVNPRFDCIELGASAGINTMLDRYHFDLGGIEVGPKASPMRIAPEWRGEGTPPAAPLDFAIVRVRGCDVAPINLADPASALQLKAYVWPEAAARMERIDAAIAFAAEAAPDVVREDAADFTARLLAEPLASGTTRVLFHSIMWQYMPARTQDAIAAMMHEHGQRATAKRPLAWISLETNPATFAHELTARYWDGGANNGTRHNLANAHPHGAWIEWL